MACPRSIPFLSLLLLLLCCSPSLAWKAEVRQVSDGDTIRVLPLEPITMPDGQAWDGKTVRVRLQGIDAPEGPGRSWNAQPYSRKSADFLKTLLPPGSPVTIVDEGYDKYERTVAGVVALPDGKVVQEELLKNGWAWVYPKYCGDCRQWKALEQGARDARRGLWQGLDNGLGAVPPWQWRKR